MEKEGPRIKAGFIAQVTTAISAVWAFGVWFSGIIVTPSDIERQNLYIDYKMSKVELELMARDLREFEKRMDAGETIKRTELRRYEENKLAYPELKKKVNDLAQTFGVE